MIKKLVFFLLIFLFSSMYGQNDTIFTSDTIISSVRIMNQNDSNLRYFYIDSNKQKVTKNLSLEKINKLVYETKKIEVFCDLVSTKKFLGTEESISVNYGTRDSLWFAEQIYTLTASELKEYNSIIDALNYMGNEGWKTIGSYSTSHNSYIVEHYILKKEITK